MTSTAISSQLATLSIGTTAGAAKTLTAISTANPAMFTSTAHGFSKGDIVTLAAILGMTQLNGVSGVVQYLTANNFNLGIDTTGMSAYTSGGTATPTAWQQISNIKTFTGFDGAASELDVSNLQSLAKEYRLGLQDPGQFSMELDLDAADLGQAALLSHQGTAASSVFKLVLPNNSTATFTAFVKKVGAAGGVDSVVKRSVDLRISGPVVWS